MGSNLDAYIIFVKSPTGTHGEMHLLPNGERSFLFELPQFPRVKPVHGPVLYPWYSELTTTFTPHGCSKSEYHDGRAKEALSSSA